MHQIHSQNPQDKKKEIAQDTWLKTHTCTHSHTLSHTLLIELCLGKHHWGHILWSCCPECFAWKIYQVGHSSLLGEQTRKTCLWQPESFKVFQITWNGAADTFKCSQDEKSDLSCDSKPDTESVQQPAREVKPGAQICKKASGRVACGSCPICEFHKKFLLLCWFGMKDLLIFLLNFISVVF